MKFENVYVEYNGKLVNVNTLPKEEYEYFLELMHRVRLAYITLTRLVEPKNKTK
jgi:hypothetical protein